MTLLIAIREPAAYLIRVGPEIRLWSPAHFLAAALGVEGLARATTAVAWMIYLDRGQVIERSDAEQRARASIELGVSGRAWESVDHRGIT